MPGPRKDPPPPPGCGRRPCLRKSAPWRSPAKAAGRSPPRAGCPKSSVNRWLQALREDCPTRIANSTEIIANAVAGYKALYDKALESFCLSQADKVTERVVETTTVRGPKKKRTVCTVNQAGNPALLAAAHRAVDGIAKIAARVAPRGGEGRGEREKRGWGEGAGYLRSGSGRRGGAEGGFAQDQKDRFPARFGAACLADIERRDRPPRQTRSPSPPDTRATKGGKICRKKRPCRMRGS